MQAALRAAGVIFYAQHLFEPFVVDFYVPSMHLVIEVDGSSHASAAAQCADAIRSRSLLGRRDVARIVRVTNDEAIAGVDLLRLLSGLTHDARSFDRSAPGLSGEAA